jgi:hypothetical protein
MAMILDKRVVIWQSKCYFKLIAYRDNRIKLFIFSGARARARVCVCVCVCVGGVRNFCDASSLKRQV